MATDIFHTVKQIPMTEVLEAFLPGAEIGYNRKISCPFHPDKTPSFHIYSNGWKCFGCGESGDSVDFIVKLYGLRPIESARLIAEKFGLTVRKGPLSKKDKLKISQAKADRLREKKLKQAFEGWARLAGQQVRTLAEAIRLQLEEKGLNIDEKILFLVHELPQLEYWADILTEGGDEEKVELYRNSKFRRWFN